MDSVRVPNPSEVAWRVHSAQEAWAGRVDVKASIVLAFEGGLTVVVATNGMLSRGGPHWADVVGLGGLGLLMVAIAFACAAIVPVLGTNRRNRAESTDNLIYFGHVRHLGPDALVNQLLSMTTDEEVGMVARQVARLGRLNWWKHRLLQMSIVFSVLALAALATSGVASTLG